MFDHEGVKTVKVIWSLFLHVKPKKIGPPKYEIKGHNMHNPNQFMASQNLLYIFFNDF